MIKVRTKRRSNTRTECNKMVLSFGTVNIKVEKFESYEALDDALALCEAGSMYAGQKRGSENAWNMIAVTDAETGEYFGIGLLTASIADPHVLVLANGLMFIGGDSFAIAFDFNERQVNTLMPLPSDFVDFIYIEDRKCVLIIHKKGVIVKDSECKELWRHSAGPITGYSVEGDLFIMERQDGEEIAFKIKNGREVDLGSR